MEVKEKIEKKYHLLMDYLAELDSVLPETEEEYCSNILHRNASERLVQKISDTSSDIIALMCKVHDAPSTAILDFATMVGALESKSLLSKKMAAGLVDLYGFKNRVLYNYGMHEQHAAYDILVSEFLPFFEQFAEYLATSVLPSFSLEKTGNA